MPPQTPGPRHCSALLLALVALPALCAAFGPTHTSCCSFNATELEAIAPVAQCDDGALTLASPCQKCPSGTCRLDKQCHCAADFLANLTLHVACANSFDAPYPRSLGREDISFRSCNASFVPQRVNSPVCCFSSRQELLSLRGIDPICPLEEYEPRVSEKCNPCPPGRCIHGPTCLCPTWALGSDHSRFKAECKAHYGRPWPESVGQPDTDRRSCDPEEDTVTASAISCCALQEPMLQMMRGRHPRCPQRTDDEILDELISTRCKTCDPGACRIGSRCICPGNFLRSEKLQRSCNVTFGLRWPKSIDRFEQGSFFNCAVRRIPRLREKSARIPKPLGFATRRADIEFPRPGLSWIEVMGICSSAIALFSSTYLVWRPLRRVHC